jgi:DNA-binding SARP family transcriptional activator/tetratricopeptide (TPR) repeat protein
VWFALLGTLTLTETGDERVVLPSPRQRTLLATLLLSANVPVSRDALAETVWDGTPPPAAPATLRNHVRRLRHAVGPGIAARIRTQDPGYLCEVAEDELDVLRFEALCRAAGMALRAGEWADASTSAARAIGLWRGTPLLDIPSQTLRDEFVPRLEQLRIQALEDRIEAELRLCQHDRLVPELLDLAARYPLRERFRVQLMLALAQNGRPAEALAAYRDARRALVDELGIEPGPELRDLHEKILAGDPSLASPPERDGTFRGTAVVPRQLPVGVRHFAGRTEQLKTLTLLLGRAQPGGCAVVISALDGTPGVGKTALAVHWAHRHADLFPDGELYVNLCGFDPSGSPVTATTAVRRFLDALAVPAARIPADPDAQFDLYRSVLADRRMLIILDNARDADQVRPLLPGAGACRVLVTSRNQLTGLVALDGAIPLTVDLLTRDEARELLTRRLGPERVVREQSAVDELIDLCARLPLALNIAAARAVTQPNTSLRTLAVELRDARRRLDVLSAGPGAADVRAVFSWSYDALSEPAARLLRLLGIHPGPDISLPAAASLAGLALDRTRHALDELTAARLLTEHPPGRYGLHDLLRAYAAEQADRHSGAEDRHEAVHRMLDHYLYAAHAAAAVRHPGWVLLDLDRPRPGVAMADLTDRDEALAWYEAEHHALPAVVAKAADAGFNRHAWQITWGWAGILDLKAHWRELAALSEIALSAARRCGDKLGQAFAHRWLGDTLATLGHLAEAHAHLDRAVTLFGVLGDSTNLGGAHHLTAWLFSQEHRFTEALHHERQALDLYRRTDHTAGQAWALNSIGFYTAKLGEHEQALAYCREGLDLARLIDSLEIEAATLDSLAYAYHHLGRHDDAITCYRRAVHLRQVTQDSFFLSRTLTALGETYHDAGDTEAARDVWRNALHILDELEHPDAAQVRAKLDGLDVPRQQTG